MPPLRQFSSFFLALLAGVAAIAAQPAAPKPVLVEFYVVRQDGQPIRDIRPEEVVIRVDGRPRALQSLQQIAIADPPSDDAARPIPPPPPFGTNVVDASARTVILVLDDDSFRPGREHPLRESVGQFLVELSAQDRVALVTVPYGGLKVDFTIERERVNQALSKIVGQAPPNQSGSDFACRTRRTLESLTGLLESLTGGEGPLTVLFFSSGLAGPRRDAPITRAPGPCELTTEDFRKVGVASSAARAHFYVIMPDPVMMRPERAALENIAGAGFTGSDNPFEGLEHLAGITGGQLFDLTATGSNILSRVSRETASFYVAALAPEASDRGGSRHQLEIRVTRGDTTVRSRPELTLPRADARPSARKSKSPREMLRDPGSTRDLPLRGIGYVSQNEGDNKVKIVVILEPVDPSVKLSGAAAALIDQKGRLAPQWTANSEELSTPPVMAALVASAGTYRLRVAATDAAGRGGTADYEIVAELAAAGPVKLSGLVLGLSRAGSFGPKLQFGAEPVAIGYLEVYGPVSAPLSATFELAASLNGQAIVRVPGAVTETSDAQRRLVTAALPIGSLQPGDYVVRAVVGVQGQPSGRVIRTLRKVLR